MDLLYQNLKTDVMYLQARSNAMKKLLEVELVNLEHQTQLTHIGKLCHNFKFLQNEITKTLDTAKRLYESIENTETNIIC